MSTTLFRQRKANVSVREAPCQTRNSTAPWPRSRTCETPENIVENIQEELKSYLSSALQLFEQLPSGPKTTGHPGTLSYKAQSNNAHSLSANVSQCTIPQLPCHVVTMSSPTLVEAQAAKNTSRKQYLALAKRCNLFQLTVQNEKVKKVFTTETSSPHLQPNSLKSFQVM